VYPAGPPHFRQIAAGTWALSVRSSASGSSPVLILSASSRAYFLACVCALDSALSPPSYPWPMPSVSIMAPVSESMMVILARTVTSSHMPPVLVVRGWRSKISREQTVASLAATKAGLAFSRMASELAYLYRCCVFCLSFGTTAQAAITLQSLAASLARSEAGWLHWHGRPAGVSPG